jgi:dihydroflavonol-4-reductase
MVFVTGGSGLVGAAVLKAMLQQGVRIRALHHKTYPVTLNESELKCIEWVNGSILDPVLLEEAMATCSKVIHCAAVVSFHPARREEMYRFNVEGTANVVNASLTNGIEKLVHVSSVAALGRLRNGEIVNEESQWSKETSNSHYGQSKYLSEMEVWRGIGEGLYAAIVNPSIILGEAKWDSGSSALFKKAWHSFPWYTNGGTGFVDVQDVARAILLLLDRDISGERFILSNEFCSYKELLTKTAVAFGKNPPRREAPSLIMNLLWRAEALKAIFSKEEPLLTKETVSTAKTTTRYDASKITRVIPDMRFTPLSETIQRTCEWMRAYYSLDG